MQLGEIIYGRYVADTPNLTEGDECTPLVGVPGGCVLHRRRRLSHIDQPSGGLYLALELPMSIGRGFSAM